MTTGKQTEYQYKIYYGKVSTTTEIDTILNDKSKVAGEIVSVSLDSNNHLLVTYKVEIVQETTNNKFIQRK